MPPRARTGSAGRSAQTRIARVLVKKLDMLNTKGARRRVDITTRGKGRLDPSINRHYTGNGKPKGVAAEAPDTRPRWQPNTDYHVRNADTGTTAVYRTDSRGRVYNVKARLTRTPSGRNQTQQSWAGGRDRIQAHPRLRYDPNADAGGHWVAAEHGGSREGINYSAQNTELNSSGAWRRMEEEFGELMDQGYTVDVDMYGRYADAGERPHAYSVWAHVTGPDGTPHPDSPFEYHFRNSRRQDPLP